MHSLIVFGPNAMIYVEMRPGVTVARREMVKVIANQVEMCKRHTRTSTIQVSRKAAAAL